MRYATTARQAPMTNGMRQPQSSSWSWVNTKRCSTTSTSIAVNCPPINVTYWKLE